MNKLPLTVWSVESPQHPAAALHKQLDELVASHRVVTARDLIAALGGSRALPDVALLTAWDAALAAQLDELPRVWLDAAAAAHAETCIGDPATLPTALVTAVNLGRARELREVARRDVHEDFNRTREPLPDLGDFALHFQAQWSIDGAALTGAETLLRWNGLPVPELAPEALIAAAEHRGDMRRLGDWIIQRACRHAADWRALWPGSMRLMINISPLQLAAEDFSELLAAALDDNRLEPTLVELEIAASALPRLAERHSGVIADLYDLGVGFALDGLGAELLDTELVTWLPATAWKLHRELIARLPDDPAAAALVGALIDAAQAQHIVTVAVGVEHEAQRELLQSLGCDALQGYLFNEALPPQQFEALLGAHVERRAR